ncbi:YbaL family putative K(+) efflux transporter [Novosphingobium aerophilum]|uniref:YbaL family putative K(+) efflux transporter n=1 Tax=Novosphingobium TaxID=165696 RepID=UPI0006C847BB|nr:MULTISPECIES: YbaL family putative K(+) efflux transporter [unclassified Novosphingobium]KPH62570.1 cation:proton antiport protein [Novosphingobium sp. ST904]TCM33057.1 Kef-type potassium/proton antiporter (CPA2 family) [Novosphingobium sp. ST904]WRT94925.1 YbaL family putative K(+) efflux transporter [Novosphingobium sp. RL4]
MPHHTPLIGTIVAGLVAAFAMGALAHRLRISPVAGYLFAGVLVGPFTPGFVANSALANELAEIGVILLMFGVGLHFSLRDLMSVKAIAVPGAVLQIAVATALGAGLAVHLGWSLAAGLVFGLALSVASTVVLLRALQAGNLVDTERGRIAIGWLIVEDLAMVLVLVLLPVLAGILNGAAADTANLAKIVGITIAKVGGFIALMLIVGKRAIPAALHWAAHTGSRELFRLAVLAIALGVAFGAAYVFDVSFALGAFFAGMVMGERQLSRRAAEETLPLRDAFAVLFFVSVGMLFDPAVLIERTGALAATVLIIVIGKSAVALAIVRAFGHPLQTGFAVAAGLAQIGEFSFMLAALGVRLDLLPEEGRDLILAGAILSILANPLIFRLLASRHAIVKAAVPTGASPTGNGDQARRGHVILVGYGRVGKLVADGMGSGNRSLVIVEEQDDLAKAARETGLDLITGNAATADILDQAGIRDASKLIIAIPEGFEGGVIAQRARQINPEIEILARAHSDEEVEHLKQVGADHVVMGEREIARSLLTLASIRRPRPA